VGLLAVSIDLDDIPNYFQIHGLNEPSGAVRTLVYDVALPRFRAFARDVGIPLTLFCIGSDLAREASARELALAASEGHEIGNHTLDHMYDFSRLSKSGIRTQIEGGIHAIHKAVGVMPAGFRAPGYTINDEVFEALSQLEVKYDSSVFPCPAYYGAKSLAMGKIALSGRQTRSILDSPNVLRAPTEPYRVGKPYWKPGEGIVEIPVQVTRGLRLPFIGTSVTLFGPTAASALARQCVGDRIVNLELHGIDALDEHDGLEALRAHQPDVRVPLTRKLESLRAAIGTLRRKGYSPVTMHEAAASV
jgi:peptidoglycan-N-acetylglucosamine deacetylase